MELMNTTLPVEGEVGASDIACLLACGSICALTYAAGGLFYASVATIL